MIEKFLEKIKSNESYASKYEELTKEFYMRDKVKAI